MNIGDIKHWHQARQRLFWSGWPATLFRFAGTATLLCGSAAGAMLFTAPPEDPRHIPETNGLSQAINACRQLRSAAEHERETQQNAENLGAGADPRNPAGPSDNWLMDSSGRRWVFDRSIDSWKRAP